MIMMSLFVFGRISPRAKAAVTRITESNHRRLVTTVVSTHYWIGEYSSVFISFISRHSVSTTAARAESSE